MKLPNFFIVGAPKCGTTALAQYLAARPDVYICKPKEPNYFCHDFPRLQEFCVLQDYLDLFASATPKHLAVGEASTWYLHSRVALKEIVKVSPEAKFVAMLRNPVDLVQSLHSQFIFNGVERELDFSRAWRRDLAHCSSQFTHYRSIGCLAEHVERFLEFTHSKSSGLVVFYDDFAENTETEYLKVISHLGLSDDGRTEFGRVNENKRPRSLRLADFARKPPNRLVHLSGALKAALGISRWGVMDKVLSYNTRVAPRAPVSESLRAELVAEFSPEIERLGRLLGRDLSCWMMPR